MTTAAAKEGGLKFPPSEERDALDVHRILSLVPLRPYSVMANIGCGTGQLVLPLAKFLWDGKVYAVDSDEVALESLKQRVAQARLGNVTIIKSEGDSVPLEEGSVDGVLVSWVLSRAASPAGLMKQAIAAVRKSGWCAVIDWRPDAPGSEGPPAERRIAVQEVERLGKEEGLRPVMHRELNELYYLVVMGK